jgi:hypothetical protein
VVGESNRYNFTKDTVLVLSALLLVKMHFKIFLFVMFYFSFLGKAWIFRLQGTDLKLLENIFLEVISHFKSFVTLPSHKVAL